MRTSDFDYVLPPELIAREPARPRDSSRMMLLERKTGRHTDSYFRTLPAFLNPSDVLVINDARVIRARIHGRLERAAGTRRHIEVLFANPLAGNTWEVLCRPGRRIRRGDRIVFGNGEAEGVFTDVSVLQMNGPVEKLLEAYGHVPIPPYLEREDTATDT